MRWVGRKLLLLAKLLGPQCSRSVPVDSAMQHTVGRSSGQQRGQISVGQCWTDKCWWISSLPTWLPTFPPTSHPSLPTYICSDIRSSLRYESHLAPYLPSHYPPIPTNLYQLFTLWKFEAFSTHWVWVPNLVSNKNKRITSNYDCSKKRNK